MNSMISLVRDGILSEILSFLEVRGNKWNVKKDGGQDERALRSELLKYFRSRTVCTYPEHIYQKTSEVFCYNYLIPNIIKNYYMICELYNLGILNKVNNIVDIGSGPGTFPLAYLLWINHHKEIENRFICITMVDPVKSFFEFFQSLWAYIKSDEKHNIKIYLHNELFNGDITKYSDEANLFIMSNSLSEILRDRRLDKKRIANNIIDSESHLAIIDYGYNYTDGMMRDFLFNFKGQYSNQKYSACKSWNREFDLVNLNKVAIKKENGETTLRKNVKFIKTILSPLHRKDEPKLPLSTEIILAYKNAWENHDVNTVEKIFLNDAIYIEKVATPPLSGLNRICEYWEENSKKQSLVTFEPIFIDKIKNWINVIWRSKFYRKDLLKWFSLTGNINAEIFDSKIKLFNESFKKSITEHPEW